MSSNWVRVFVCCCLRKTLRLHSVLCSPYLWIPQTPKIFGLKKHKFYSLCVLTVPLRGLKDCVGSSLRDAAQVRFFMGEKFPRVHDITRMVRSISRAILLANDLQTQFRSSKLLISGLHNGYITHPYCLDDGSIHFLKYGYETIRADSFCSHLDHLIY